MEAVFTKVQDVLDNYQKAVHEQDVEKFVSTYAEDVHIFDCWGKWECEGAESWRASVVDWFNGLKAEEVTLKVLFSDTVIEESGELAFIHSNVTFAAHNAADEKLRQMTNRFTFGLKRADGEWKVTHEHSSLPISMETGKGMFNLK
ncbi:YybH family protein [Falsibacillus pallidus]|uniref:Uncharacterized protein (TIGR02246 family) n=1 Tax=Falsibacillus pallidus TaxID=493781 RepID=A0A370FY98_9BACI|nr:nuclear transport factor 2 family protein [Falsibacillus pallidus]RDI36435.1 uncharacterized protein (TIGR02246 family) [Falsibacillus pallidus]